MTRQQKINKIKGFIDGYNNIKDYVLTNQFFYTDGNNFYTDRNHKNQVSKAFIDQHNESERIRQKARNIIPIIVRNKNK